MDSSQHRGTWLPFAIANQNQQHQMQIFGVEDQHNERDGPGNHLPQVLVGGVPKLEDFLGDSGGGTSVAAQFENGASGVNVSDHMGMGIYDDFDLKRMTANFLNGYSPEQTEHTQKQLVPAPTHTEPPAKRNAAAENYGQRTSIFRGVTRHRWTGRYEAHLWDNSCRREGQSRKGRQVYLGGYDKEEKAARAYDLAALKYWGPTTTTNFPVSDYEKEMEDMKNMTRQEFVASLRRKSSGFSRGASMYRGVTRHHQHGRWQARIGRVAGNKDLYLGTFSTQEEAAEAYDIAAIKFRGLNAVTNFDISRYDVRSIASNNLPVGGAGATNKSKTIECTLDVRSIDEIHQHCDDNNTDTITINSTSPVNFALPLKQEQSSSPCPWVALGCQNPNVHPSIFSYSTVDATTSSQSQGTLPPFSLQFPCQTNNHGSFYNGDVYYRHQLGATTSSSTSENGMSEESRLSLRRERPVPEEERPFHTPIFGIE